MKGEVLDISGIDTYISVAYSQIKKKSIVKTDINTLGSIYLTKKYRYYNKWNTQKLL